MKTFRKAERGFADIAIAIGILTVGAIMSFIGTRSAQVQVGVRMVMVNATDGFYGGEIAAISAYLNNANSIAITGLGTPDTSGNAPVNIIGFNSGALEEEYRPEPSSLICEIPSHNRHNS